MKEEFRVYKLTEEGTEIAREMALKFDDLAGYLESKSESPNSETFGIVMQKLAEACFYAKKAMAPRYSIGFRK